MFIKDTKLFEEIKEYFVSVEKLKDYFIVKIQYKPKWIVEEGEFDGIKVVKSTTKGNDGEYFYLVKFDDEGGIDRVMKMCLETKKYNVELTEKAKIYKEKCEELKALIFNTPLNKLGALSFTFKKKKKKVNEVVQTEDNSEAVEKEEK